MGFGLLHFSSEGSPQKPNKCSHQFTYHIYVTVKV